MVQRKYLFAALIVLITCSLFYLSIRLFSHTSYSLLMYVLYALIFTILLLSIGYLLHSTLIRSTANRKQLEEAMLYLFDISDSVFIRWANTPERPITYISKNITKLLGYTPAHFIHNNQSYYDCIHKDDLPRVREESAIARSENAPFVRHSPYRLVALDGSIKWVLDQTVIQKNAFGETTYFIANILDITKQKNIENELAKNKLRWEFAVEGNKDGLWEWNPKNNDIFYSPQWKRMLGYTDEEISNIFTEWYQRIHPDDVERIQKDIADFLEGKTEHYINEHRLLCKDGDYRWIRARGIIVDKDLEGNPERIIGTHTDITDYVEALEAIREQTYYDELTKLGNRKAYNERMTEMIDQYKRYGIPFSMLMLDIDDFKEFNDHYGHDVGDKILYEIGNVLRCNSRTNDYCFRIGGEEFVILLTDTRLDGAILISEHIRSIISDSVRASENPTLPVTVSIGIVEVMEDDDYKSLFKRADDYLYMAKSEGKNRVHYHKANEKVL